MKLSRSDDGQRPNSMGAGPRSTFLLVVVTFAMSASCFRSRAPGYHRPRGTCESACDYYHSCKNVRPNAEAAKACVVECRGVFTDPFVLRAFERLSCEEAVSFVEGPSGRGPGE